MELFPSSCVCGLAHIGTVTFLVASAAVFVPGRTVLSPFLVFSAAARTFLVLPRPLRSSLMPMSSEVAAFDGGQY